MSKNKEVAVGTILHRSVDTNVYRSDRGALYIKRNEKDRTYLSSLKLTVDDVRMTQPSKSASPRRSQSLLQPSSSSPSSSSSSDKKKPKKRTTTTTKKDTTLHDIEKLKRDLEALTAQLQKQPKKPKKTQVKREDNDDEEKDDDDDDEAKTKEKPLKKKKEDKKNASPKRTSPKRESPKRTSQKRESPKRTSPKRESPKRTEKETPTIKTLKYEDVKHTKTLNQESPKLASVGIPQKIKTPKRESPKLTEQQQPKKKQEEEEEQEGKLQEEEAGEDMPSGSMVFDPSAEKISINMKPTDEQRWPELLEDLNFKRLPEELKKNKTTKKLGSGSYGAEYLTRDPLKNKMIAMKKIKIPDDHARWRFANELDILQRLKGVKSALQFDAAYIAPHDHATFDDPDDPDETLAEKKHAMYLSTESLHEWQTMDKWIMDRLAEQKQTEEGKEEEEEEGEEEERESTEREIKNEFQQSRTEPTKKKKQQTTKIKDNRLSVCDLLLNALADLHAHKVAHRDIKPENVMISRSMRQIKFIDFGESCHAERCQSRGIVGSPSYMAPEVVELMADDLTRSGCRSKMFGSGLSEDELSFEFWREADCWSLGMLMLNVLTLTFDKDSKLFTPIMPSPPKSFPTTECTYYAWSIYERTTHSVPRGFWTAVKQKLRTQFDDDEKRVLPVLFYIQTIIKPLVALEPSKRHVVLDRF